MVYQIHRQRIDNNRITEMVAQGEPPEPFNDASSGDFFRDWLADVATRHELPDGWQWMICDEDSEYFVRYRIVRSVVADDAIRGL